MKYEIPGFENLELNTIILDLNGTLTVGGVLVDGVKERIEKLKKNFSIYLFSGDTRGNGKTIADDLEIHFVKASSGEEKKQELLKLNPETTVSIGNGLIDVEITKIARLGIVTLQSEGVHIQTLLASDIIVPNINDALDILIDDNRLIATLRE